MFKKRGQEKHTQGHRPQFALCGKCDFCGGVEEAPNPANDAVNCMHPDSRTLLYRADAPSAGRQCNGGYCVIFPHY